ERHPEAAPAAVAGEGDRRAGPEVTVAARRSRVLDVVRSGGDGRRSVSVALLSTVVFLVLVGVAGTHAPGWPEVKQTFFDWGTFRDSLPEIAHAFRLNCKIFLIA